LLVHVPLSRVNSLFCVVTAFVPMMFNIRTKYWIYEKTNRVVCLFFRNDKEALNYVLKPKHLRYKSETRKENLDDKNPYSEIVLSKVEQEQ